MNEHLQKAIEIYEKRGFDFKNLLTWHLCHGVVLCLPDFFGMGYHADSGNPSEPVQYHHSDTLFCTFFTGDMRHGLDPLVDRYKFFSFQRSFRDSPRVRVVEMQKFFSKLK